MSTRGIRNNNPGNIRRACNWKGSLNISTDPEFCQFISMSYGVRALLITLRTYVVKHHLHTVREIITRWAPPSDGNNTERYIKFVESSIEYGCSKLTMTLQPKDFKKEFQHSECILYLIAKAICKMESGYDLSYGIYRYAISLM